MVEESAQGDETSASPVCEKKKADGKLTATGFALRALNLHT